MGIVVVAVAAPRDKVIGCDRFDRGGIGRLRPRQDRDLTCLDASVATGPGILRPSTQDPDAQWPLPVSSRDVVRAGNLQPDGALRNIDLDGFIFTGLAQAEANSTAREEDLSDSVEQARDLDFAAIGQVDRFCADSDLAAGSRVGAQCFTGEDRLIQFGISPGSPARHLQVEVSRDKADPPDSVRRRPVGRQRSARLDRLHRLGLRQFLRDRRQKPSNHRDTTDADKQSHGSDPPSVPCRNFSR